MKEPEAEQTRVRDYLLGHLDEGGRQEVEERLITDPDYLEEVLIVESELMEEYLDGVLPESDKEGFVRYVLATQRQVEKLTVAQALSMTASVDAAANSPPKAKRTTRPFSFKPWFFGLPRAKRRAARLSLAAIVLVVIFGTLAVIMSLLNRGISLEQEVQKLNAQQYMDKNAISHGFIIGPLRSGTFRDEEINQLAIPKTERMVQVRLRVGPGDYSSFQATLQTVAGETVLSLSDLKEQRLDGERLVIVYLPTRILTPGDYQLRLSGLTQNGQPAYLGRYAFRILGN